MYTYASMYKKSESLDILLNMYACFARVIANLLYKKQFCLIFAFFRFVTNIPEKFISIFGTMLPNTIHEKIV